METAPDVLRAQAGADGALLDDLHGCGQRPGTQQQRDLARLGSGHAAADLDPPAADLLADDRRGHHFALALFHQHHGHALAHVLARDLLEDARTGAIESDVHCRLPGLVVEARLRIGDAVAGQHHLALEQDRMALAVVQQLGAEWNLSLHRRLQRGRIAVLLVDHPHFQRGGAPEDALGVRGVLHAGQLDHDAIGTGLLDDRLRHAQLVHPVAQRGQVLLDGELLNALLRLRPQRTDQQILAVAILATQQQVGEIALDEGAGLVAAGALLEAHHQLLALAADAAAARVLLAAQRAADSGAEAVQGLGDRTLHVDLEQEMHAPAQVQTEVHRLRADRGEPAR